MRRESSNYRLRAQRADLERRIAAERQRHSRRMAVLDKEWDEIENKCAHPHVLTGWHAGDICADCGKIL